MTHYCVPATYFQKMIDDLDEEDHDDFHERLTDTISHYIDMMKIMSLGVITKAQYRKAISSPQAQVACDMSKHTRCEKCDKHVYLEYEHRKVPGDGWSYASEWSCPSYGGGDNAFSKECPTCKLRVYERYEHQEFSGDRTFSEDWGCPEINEVEKTSKCSNCKKPVYYSRFHHKSKGLGWSCNRV